MTSNNKVVYRVLSIKDLTCVIIPHFEKYPLLTQKRADFELFKSAIKLVNEGEHLLKEGLIKIVSVKAAMNRGLSSALSEHFPTTIFVERPSVESQIIYDPNWLVGFTSAEGLFFVSIGKSKTKTGFAVSL